MFFFYFFVGVIGKETGVDKTNLIKYTSGLIHFFLIFIFQLTVWLKRGKNNIEI
jgi:hypothetical protein